MSPHLRLTAIVIFLGSFLLFGVQPMMGRTLLPSFGGTAAVWTACLAAYQLLLLGGYGYAHGVSKLAPRTQRRLHLGLLVLAVLWTLLFAFFQQPIRAALGNSAEPGLEVLLAVTVLVGLPYVLLASGSTLLQSWLAQAGAGRGVYRLYAVSNLGSFLGLLAHPLLLEPYVAVTTQWYGFAAALALYALLLLCVARLAFPPEPSSARVDPTRATDHGSPITDHPSPTLPPSLTRPWLWYFLPGLSSFLLVATTNHLTLDVTPIPLMWALVLGLFLLSYAVGFSTWGERALPLWGLLAAGAVATMAAATIAQRDLSSETLFHRAIVAGLPAFFALLLFIHGWLYTIRPDKRLLTHFYLGIAAGGAVGGTLAGLAAPLVFRTVAEYPLVLIATALTVGTFLFIWRYPSFERGLKQAAMVACASVAFFVLQPDRMEKNAPTLYRDRGFYGTVAVYRGYAVAGAKRHDVNEFVHGRTKHGAQIRSPEFARRATTYFGPGGGGATIASHPKVLAGEPIRFACIGLGVGVMATYGRPGDTYRFYEISPEVLGVATNPAYFSFLADCRAKVELVAGDARKALERERAAGEPGYDVLVLDAYSGDAIPVHLATDEAFDLYRARLAPGGVLALHISNWQFDLLPLCKRQAERLGLKFSGIHGLKREAELIDPSCWVFLTESVFALKYPAVLATPVDWSRVRTVSRPLTDECGSLLPYLMRMTPKPTPSRQPPRPALPQLPL